MAFARCFRPQNVRRRSFFKKEFMTTNNDNTQYLPTFLEWEKMYTQWSEKLAKSLWSFGGQEECREAVHEAFLKAMGLSDRLHLRDKLTPKVDGEWFGFLRNQAKGILSHRHQAAKRFVELKEYGLTEETLNEDDWGDEDGTDVPVSGPGGSAGDSRWLKAVMRKAVEEVCREAGVSERNVRAFVHFVLDEVPGKVVVSELPSLKNANNLYQVRDRVTKLLKASSDRFEEIHDELLAA